MNVLDATLNRIFDFGRKRSKEYKLFQTCPQIAKLLHHTVEFCSLNVNRRKLEAQRKKIQTQGAERPRRSLDEIQSRKCGASLLLTRTLSRRSDLLQAAFSTLDKWLEENANLTGTRSDAVLSESCLPVETALKQIAIDYSLLVMMYSSAAPQRDSCILFEVRK